MTREACARLPWRIVELLSCVLPNALASVLLGVAIAAERFTV